jgi:hypothetical protein
MKTISISEFQKLAEDEVKKFFGPDWLAKELYEEAGIDDVS